MTSETARRFIAALDAELEFCARLEGRGFTARAAHDIMVRLTRQKQLWKSYRTLMELATTPEEKGLVVSRILEEMNAEKGDGK